MVFSSIPAYLDPSNWQHQQNQQIIGSSSTNPLLPPLPQPPPGNGPHPAHGGPGTGSIRPGSMAERARLANIPLPEAALKCPRCESTNTKFCYFNNYNLSQPRHFCKTCRRYWTRGGSLRNIPVGGGCRRNKRSKPSSTSKSPASNDMEQTRDSINNSNNNNPSSTSSTNPTHGGSAAASIIGLPPLRFMSPFAESFVGDHHNMGLGDYTGIAPPAAEMSFIGGGGDMDPWRLQQVQKFPFLGGFEQPAAGVNYQFNGGESSFMGGGGQTTSHHHHHHHHQTMRPKFSSSMLSQLASIKMEDRPGLNLSRQLLGNINNNNDNDNNNNHNQNTVNWTELSRFNSSSTSNHM